jgi:hypothetical protein
MEFRTLRRSGLHISRPSLRAMTFGAGVRSEWGSGEAWIASLNIKFSHREAKDPQEPIQAWLDVKRIDGISDFSEFGEIYTAHSSHFPFVFNYFRMALYVHSLRVQAFTRGLPERRGNDMQSSATCRARPFSCPSHKRTSSGSTREHDRRAHCAGNRSCGP